MATGSPTKRTRSTASSGSCHSPPSGKGAVSLGAPSVGGGGMSSKSATVSTATTPGTASAAEASMPVISACASGLRTNVTRAAPVSSGTLMSSTYAPPTVSNLGSSVRATRVPMMLTVTSGPCYGVCASLASRSAPGEGGVADRVELAGAVAGEPERFEQSLPFAEQFPGDQCPDADHLVAVVGVGYHVGVLAESVEDREAVGGERTDAAGGLLAVQVALAFEPLEAVGEPGGPHPGEVFANDELRT